MHSLHRDLERRLVETPRLPTPTVLLASLAALSIASAVPTLLSEGW
jgi:hypothetical protein